MFAVPGWNVAAKSLVAEQAKPVKDPSSKSAAPSQHPANSTKRKRDQGSKKQGLDVTSKPHDIPRNESSALSGNKKRRIQLQPNAEKASFDPNQRSQKGKKSRRNHGTSSSSTGANAEPVRPMGRSRSTHPPTSTTSSKERTSNPHGSGRNEADCSPSTGDATEKSNSSSLPPAPPLPPLPPSTHLTPLQAKMRAKLTAARFRHLNETLYTTSSNDALQLFTNSPDLFREYHAGFAQQVKDSWPQNPVDIYIENIKVRGALASPVNGTPLPRRRPGTCSIADLGCGDAPLARGLQATIKPLNLKLHSYDLHASNSHVTQADISALPLHDGEIDIAIFCLSLMGTNWLAFVEEAWRVLRGDGKGEVWVAEVKSRFGRTSASRGAGKVVDNSVGKRRKAQIGKKSQSKDDRDDENPTAAEDEREAAKPGADDDTDLGPFVETFHRRGFALREGSIDRSNKMFVTMIFTKVGTPRAGKWKGMKWNGREYQRVEDRTGSRTQRFQGGWKSFPDGVEIDEQEEGKLLKPCVYKVR